MEGNDTSTLTASWLLYRRTLDLNWFAILLLPIPVWVFFGNLSVLVVIAQNSRLRCIWSNKVIFSLAVTDMTIALIVMPFAAIGLLCNGYWPFTFSLCVFHVISDVYFCSSSIMHLLLIAINRYVAIGWPFIYRRINSATGLQISCLIGVWGIPFLVVAPLVIHIIFNPEDIFKDDNCGIFYEVFILYGSISVFYFPLFTMIAVDIRSFYLLKTKSRNQSRLKSIMSNSSRMSKADSHTGATVYKLKNVFSKHQSPTGTPKNNSRNYAGRSAENSQSYTHRCMTSPSNLSNGSCNPYSTPRAHVRKALYSSIFSLDVTSKANSVSITIDPVKRFFRKQRAETALLTVFVVFVICWMPFFIVNVLQVFVPAVKNMKSIFIVFVWLGYCSSGVNPIIYPLFNGDYRKCFMRTFTRTEEHLEPQLRHTQVLSSALNKLPACQEPDSSNDQENGTNLSQTNQESEEQDLNSPALSFRPIVYELRKNSSLEDNKTNVKTPSEEDTLIANNCAVDGNDNVEFIISL